MHVTDSYNLTSSDLAHPGEVADQSFSHATAPLRAEARCVTHRRTAPDAKPPADRVFVSRMRRQHSIRFGRERWDVVILDPFSDDLGNVRACQNAVAFYDCSSIDEGRFVALVAANELLACDETQPISLGGRWTLNPPVLATLKHIIEEDLAAVR